MPFLKIWVHVVWATKNREPLLAHHIRLAVFQHIMQHARSNGIHVDFINGYVDHVHCLISLSAEQTVAKVVQLLKGESAFWINREKLTEAPFAWQNEYFAVSVSESAVDRVRDYIKNQEAHHKKKSFAQEYEEFRKMYNFPNPSDKSEGNARLP
jgi:REP element-mobilizing transposase RayT